MSSFVTQTWTETHMKTDNGDVELLDKYSAVVPLMSDTGYAVSAVVLALISVVGVLANSMVMFIVIREKQLRTPLNLILLNLSCSDMMIAAVGAPMSLTAALHQHWPFGAHWCVFYGMFMSVAGIASISSLTVLALWRSLLVTCPLRKFDLTWSSTALITFGIWVYSIAVCVPPLLGWGQYTFEASHISCSVNWEDPGTASYVGYMFVFGLAVPLLIIVASYASIVWVLRQRGKQIRRSRKSNRAQSQFRITIMVGVMVTTFLIAWLPYAALALVKTAAAGTPVAESISPAWATVPSLFAKCSVTFNPLVYCGLNTQFRAAWLRFFELTSTRACSKEDLSTRGLRKISDAADRLAGGGSLSTIVLQTKAHSKSRKVVKPAQLVKENILRDFQAATQDVMLNDCVPNPDIRYSLSSLDRTFEDRQWGNGTTTTTPGDMGSSKAFVNPYGILTDDKDPDEQLRDKQKQGLELRLENAVLIIEERNKDRNILSDSQMSSARSLSVNLANPNEDYCNCSKSLPTEKPGLGIALLNLKLSNEAKPKVLLCTEL